MGDIMEEWRDVVGFEGLQVSDMGKVRAVGGKEYPVRFQNGYVMIMLNGRKREYLHRLIVMTFVGPIPAGMETHHKNGNRTDNRLENLELLTRSDHQHRDFVLRCSQLEPIGPGGGMSMFDRARGYTPE